MHALFINYGVPEECAVTILVKMNGRLREVNFTRRTEVSYDADTNDDSNKRLLFKWELIENKWQIPSNGHSHPSWLTDNSPGIREGFLTELL